MDAADYGIGPNRMHPNVLFIAERLQEEGHEALVVGGAVRDLILGQRPKDFDIATSARPEAVKHLFRNARIIGRRFRLVHIAFPDMTVEVATFRGPARPDQRGLIHKDNQFGSARQDAFRRDFTMNALSLDPHAMTIIDHVGGMADLQSRSIRSISPPQQSFREDPVRMLRAVRFMLRLGFTMDADVERALRAEAPRLSDISRHRLAEETQRFLVGGMAYAAFDAFQRLGLLQPLLGLQAFADFFPVAVRRSPHAALRPYLRGLDAWVVARRPVIVPTVALLGLLLTLGRQGLRDALRGRGPEAATLFAAGRGAPLLQMLGEWGLLMGQIEPALAILRAAQAILHDAGGPGAIRRHELVGEREALTLLGVMAEVLALPEAFVLAGLERIPALPVLPILDHHMPLRRRDAGKDGKGGKPAAVGKSGAARPHARRRRRPRGATPQD